MDAVSPRSARRLLALAAAVALLAAACGSSTVTPTFPPVASPAPVGSPGTGGTASPSTAATDPGATASPDARAPGDRPDLAAVRVETPVAVEGIGDAIFVTNASDGSDRLFVAQQGGTIRIVRDGALVDTPFLDISDRVQAGGERGLLGVAFPPGFGEQRVDAYVHYSDKAGDTTISRFAVDGDRADPASEQILLTQKQPYPNHNGGWIGFDPDGMLLVALGDGGAGGDPENRASNPDELLGKLLRIDVLGAADGTGYSIPADNPFVGTVGARPEILHWGLRNPFRASVDLETGDLWIGDVGQDAWEEVDVARAGASGLDFGWRRWEGRHCYDKAAGCVESGVTMPVAEYPHTDGCSVIGGVVYRGDAIPALRGAYLFSDYCTGTLWALDAGLDAPQAPIVLAQTGRQISSIGTDESGEVWLTDIAGGALLQLRPIGG